jgi:hypothetical protein
MVGEEASALQPWLCRRSKTMARSSMWFWTCRTQNLPEFSSCQPEG